MEGEMQMSQQACFKEYLCYQFKHTLTAPPIAAIHHVTFIPGNDNDIRTLPAAIIDSLACSELFFILKWHQTPHPSLLIKELNDAEWTEVKFNVLPQAVSISGGVLFLLSGEELVMQSIYSEKQSLRRIGEGKIVAVTPCMVPFKGKSGQEYEAGISITFFSEGSGYEVRRFSLRQEKQEEEKLKRAVKAILLKKYVQFLHFQLIVANQFALVFLSETEFCLFNLQTSQIEERTRSRLIFSRLGKGRVPVVRWREHLTSEDFNKSLIVAIAIDSYIELHYICLKYLPALREQLGDTRLKDIVNGSFIDWQESLIAPYISIAAEGSCIDLAITKRGIIYCSRKNSNSEIFDCNYIDLNSVFPFPMLTQEAIIWRRYYEDKALETLTDGNRFYLPNRYPHQLVQQHYPPNYEEMRSQLLADWREDYSFKGMVAFKEEALVVRTGSISAFRMVSQELFRFQHFNEDKLAKLDQIMDLSKVQRQVHNLFLRPIFSYEQSILQGEGNRPRTGERKYKQVQREDYQMPEEAEERAEERFRLLIQELQEIMGEKGGSAYSTMNIPQFLMPLTTAQLYDRLNHYHLIANSKSFRLGKEGEREFAKEYQLYSCVIRLISYFYQLLERSEQHYLLFQDNLIGLFVNQHSQLLSSDIQTSINCYIKLFFQDLLPVKKSNYLNSQINSQDRYDNNIKTNPFIEFLVNLLIEAIKNKKIEKCQAIRQELANIVRIGFLDSKSLYFANLWKNVSLFKAVLLSKGSKNLGNYFCQYLLKWETAAFLSTYKEIRDYMLPEDTAIVEDQLFFNLPLHTLTPDLLRLAKAAPKTEESELDRHQSAILNVKQDIMAHHKLQHRQEESESVAILQQLDQLRQQFDEQLLGSISEELGQVSFTQQQKYLQYYEQVLAALISLFNSRVHIEGKNARENGEGKSQQLKNRQEELKQYLAVIEHYLGLYKQQYTKVYEENEGREEGRQHAWEMVLLKERFINNTAPLTLIKDDGLLCCSLSIQLLKLALDCPHSLQVTQNIVYYWLQWVRDASLSTNERALFIEAIFHFSREETKACMKLDNGLQRLLISLYSTLSNEGSCRYEFFEVVKGSSSSSN